MKYLFADCLQVELNVALHMTEWITCSIHVDSNVFLKFSSLDREKAIEMCRQLVERNFGHSLEKGKDTEFRDDDTVYRLLEDDESTALNSGMSSQCEPRPAPQIAEELRRLILNLYNQFLSKDGKVIMI